MQILKESSPIDFSSFFNLVKFKKNERTLTNFFFILNRKYEDSNSFHFLKIGPNKKYFFD